LKEKECCETRVSKAFSSFPKLSRERKHCDEKKRNSLAYAQLSKRKCMNEDRNRESIVGLDQRVNFYLCFIFIVVTFSAFSL